MLINRKKYIDNINLCINKINICKKPYNLILVLYMIKEF